MFFYYGGKKRLAGMYPPPLHPTIVEPFAGGAAYSMRHIRLRSVERVVLVEKDARVVETWQRVLAMSPADLLAYPVPEAGSITDDFLVMTASTSNAIARCNRMTVTPRQVRAFTMMLRSIAAVLPYAQEKVEISQGDYSDAPDVEATWFVDPPYVASERASTGTSYPQGMGYSRDCSADSIDYPALGEWCRERQGQTIVCEYAGAEWLPFRHMQGSGDGLGRTAGEVVWTDRQYQLSFI